MPVTTNRTHDYPWQAIKRGDRFCNLGAVPTPGWKEVARWKLGLGAATPVPEPLPREAPLPGVAVADFATIAHPDRAKITATWVGHATFLLQMGGLNLLTDPHFRSHCSPIPMPRFRRRTPPGILPEQLPRIDAVILSHNHYDHLDLPSLRATARAARVFCPLGVGPLLRGIGAESVEELSWGESAEIDGMKLVCLPAQHGSARGPWDRSLSLWCSWMIEQGGRRAYFAGDTGYGAFLREIGDYFGGVDLAMIPIGAYRPGWFMQSIHLNPKEAVRAHFDLRARRSVAMHWGTFALADEPLGEPALLLEEAREEAGLDPDEFALLDIGQTIAL